MKLTEMRAEVHPGAGLVARIGACVLFAPGAAEPGLTDLVDILRDLQEEEAPGRTLARRLAGLLTNADPDQIPDFCALGDAEEGLVAILHGSVRLTARGPDADITLSGRERPTWVDEYVRADVNHIEVNGGEPASTEHGFSGDLVAGVVPGGGLSLTGAGSAPEAQVDVESPAEPEEQAVEEHAVDEQAEEEPAVEEPAAEEAVIATPVPAAYDAVAFTSVDLGDLPSAAELRPLPIVGAEPAQGQDEEPETPSGEMIEGIRCVRGHFNHPEALYCAHCGISMLQVTHVIVQDLRPPLGILVFNDGRTFSLDMDYVIGRNPEIDDDISEGRARPLVLEDEDKILSRVHADVRLTGWDVDILDRGSANGTYVQTDGEWQRLTAGAQQRLDPGMRVRLGDYEFTYDSHHRAGPA